VRVCVVTTAFPRHPGDSEGTFVWESVQAIARRGVQICVVAMHTPGIKQLEVWNGIPVIRPRYWWPEQWEILRREGGLPTGGFAQVANRPNYLNSSR